MGDLRRGLSATGCQQHFRGSHIRQFLLGRQYFETTFGRYPRTACNFDPFGHGEGFPQILAGCGMERYVFCRPDFGTHELPIGPFTGATVQDARSSPGAVTITT